MDHEFELAFNMELAFDLIDEAGGRIQQQQYGVTRILSHNHGDDITLTTVHNYTRETGHHLVLIAADEHGPVATVEATAPDLDADPRTRIVKVRGGELTFHTIARTWSYRARAAGHTYTLTAEEPADLDAPLWTTTVDNGAPLAHHDLDAAVEALLLRTA